jgi:type I restriction enzyme S subunit
MVPKGWRISKIGDVVKIVGGATPSTKNPQFWNGAISFATPKDLAPLTSPILLETERRITDAGLKNISSGLLPKGTVLLSSRAPIGYLAIAEIPVAVNQGFIAMICNGDLPNYYVLTWLHENMDTILGNANGTTFLEISKKNFRPIACIVPSPETLLCFIKLVDALFKKIVENLIESNTLAAMRDLLLPELLSGNLRVKEIPCREGI